MQKRFSAPSWVLFIFGLVGIYCGLFPLVTNMTFDARAYYGGVGLIFVESYLYWIIRWKNKSRIKFWIHVILLLLAGLTPWLMYEVFKVLDNYFPTTNDPTMDMIGEGCFSAFFIVGHVLFAIVLVKASRKPPGSLDASGPEAEAEHILDEYIP